MAILVPEVGEYLRDTMRNSLVTGKVTGESIASKSSAADIKLMEFFKLRALSEEGNAKWRKRELQLIASRSAYSRAFDSIEHWLSTNTRIRRREHFDHISIFARSLQLIENEQLDVMAELLLFDAPTIVDIIADFATAHDGFMECWRQQTNVRFYYRLAALRLAFYCDVYRQLCGVTKNIQELRVVDYLACVLTKLAKTCIHADRQVLFDSARKRKAQCAEATIAFVAELFRFIDESSTHEIVHAAIADQRTKLTPAEARDVAEWLIINGRRCPKPEIKPTGESIKSVVEWLTHVQNDDAKERQSLSLTIARKPMAMAESIIKKQYRLHYKDCSSLRYSLGVVDTNCIQQSDANPLKLINAGLVKNHLVIISGNPNANRTFLAHKLIFDYSNSSSNGRNDNNWDAYDFVLLAESCSIQTQHTIVEIAMHDLEKIGINRNVCNFVHKCNRLLIIIDAYNDDSETVDQTLNRASNIAKDLLYDLIIVTGRSNNKQITNATYLTILSID